MDEPIVVSPVRSSAAGTTILYAMALLVGSLSQARADTACSNQSSASLEQQAYRVRKVSIVGAPITSWTLGSRIRELQPKLPVEQQLFRKTDFDGGRAAIRDFLHNLPVAFESPITAHVVAATVENCQSSGGSPQLDVVYHYFTSKVSLSAQRAFESEAVESKDPGDAFAMHRRGSFRLSPRLSYNPTERLLVGGAVSLRVPRVIDWIEGEAHGSSSSTIGSLDAFGSHEWTTGWLRMAEWRADGGYSDRPTDAGALRRSHVLVQGLAHSRPFGPSVIVRFGMSIEGGKQSSTLPPPDIPAGYVSDTAYLSWKNFAGLSLRTTRHSFAASYGLQLGSTGSGRLDYYKHLGDLVYAGGFAVAPHRMAQLESRVNFGILSPRGLTPAAERFFGGNVETPFMAGPSWRIRANPVIRSIPAFSLSRLEPDRPEGGESFFSLNVTASLPVWHYPLVPPEVSADREVRELVDGELNGAEEILGSSYESRDPVLRTLFEARAGFVETLDRLESRLNMLPDSEARERCIDEIGPLHQMAEELRPTNSWRPFVAEEGDHSIPTAVRECTGVKDADFGALMAELLAYDERIRTQLAKIDQAKWTGLAKRDMEFPRSVVRTIMDELNILSISLALVYDAARLGPRPAGSAAGMRYGMGGGIRVSFASSVELTAGYAVNPSPLPWERRGAFFGSLTFTNLWPE
jgi:hypothetical protein